MATLDNGNTFQVSQGARHLEYPVRGAQGQAHAFAGTLQPQLIGVAELAVLAQAVEVEKGISAALSILLMLSRRCNTGCSADGGIERVWLAVQAGSFTGNCQVQVDTVEQRSRKLAAIALNLFR